MFSSRCVLLKLTLITCVVGIRNANYIDQNETERKLTELEGNFNKTLNILESNILDKLLNYTDSKVDATNKRIPDFEEKMAKTLIASNKNLEQALITSNENLEAKMIASIRNLEGKMTQSLIASNKNLEDKMTQSLIASNKNLEDKMTQALIASNKNLEDKMTQALNASNEKITKKTLDALDSLKMELLKKIHIISSHMPCKEQSLSINNRYIPFYSLDNEALNYITVQRNSAGHLTYLNMNLAIEATRSMFFRLSDVGSDWSSDITFEMEIGREDNQYTRLDIRTRGSWKTGVERVYTPEILSSTQLRAFYIKIVNGKLEFGKKGAGSPLISHADTRLGSVKYFRFYNGGDKEANIRYDCPTPFEGSS